MSNKIFISYRRADTESFANYLNLILERVFSSTQIFIDTSEIGIGANFKTAIEQTLGESKVCLVLIGPRWLELLEDYKAKKYQDWVVHEISTCFKKKIEIIPILVDGAKVPRRESLPMAIKKLSELNGEFLRVGSLENDVTRLIRHMVEKLQIDPINKKLYYDQYYPRGDTYKYEFEALTETEVMAELVESDWKVIETNLMGTHDKYRLELYKDYYFKSFQKAIDFMKKASVFIEKMNHHPRWENIDKNVAVFICTWDKKFVITKNDIELAKAFDELYKHYPQP